MLRRDIFRACRDSIDHEISDKLIHPFVGVLAHRENAPEVTAPHVVGHILRKVGKRALVDPLAGGSEIARLHDVRRSVGHEVAFEQLAVVVVVFVDRLKPVVVDKLDAILVALAVKGYHVLAERRKPAEAVRETR